MKFAVILLLAASQLHSSSSQNIQNLLLELSEQKNFKDGLKEHPDIQQVLKTSRKTLQNLWTKDLQELLQKNTSLLTADCTKSIEYIFDDVARLVPLIDATGKPGAGVLGGNTILAAAFDECFNYNYTGYCLANPVFIKNLYTYPWKVGLCVPKYCTNTDLAVLINSTGELWVNESTILCVDSKSPSYSTGAIVMIALSSVFVALVLTGTLIDAFLKLTFKRKESKSVNSDPDNQTSEERPLLHSQKRKCKVNPLDFITAFSLFQTVPTLLATSQGSNVITCLNGLRVISMFWVILGHAYIFALAAASADNPLQFLTIAARFSFQAVGNAYFSVDSFFFLSGVLVAYLTLREMKKKNGRFPILHYYIHRYLRITPTYAFILFFATYLFIHLAAGPFMSLNDPLGPPCSKYWWTNLLYINNFYPWKMGDECFGWAWYLAIDMQFYIIAPLMLISAYHCLPASLIITGAFLVSGFTIDAVLTGVFDFQANQLSGIAYNYTSRPNATQAYGDAIYSKPWDRISPYIVGLALGYVLYRKLQFNYSKVINLVFYGALWVIATITAFWLVYGLYFTWHGHIPHTIENIIYITFSRYLWASCLALVVFSCHNGYGWFINSFLSMKLWTPLARMTFNAYLVHPVVIFVIYGQLQTPIHYTDITLVCYYVAFVVLSYAAAGVVCVAVELPLGTVELLIFKMFGLRGRESQRQDTIKTADS